MTPELSLYQGLGEAAATELNRLSVGDGAWFVMAIDTSVHPRYAALVDSFKSKASGKVVWHFLTEEMSLSFQNDGWGLARLRDTMDGQSGLKGIVLLGGSLQPGGQADASMPPVLVAGPMDRDGALAALASGQLSAAIVYRDSPGYNPGASPEDQFTASFEILRASENP